MVCEVCKLAGSMIGHAPEPDIAAIHAECRGGNWCDCQHCTKTSKAAVADHARD